ncbi:MAG TPA: SigB/SigF/SigG family RNA polymerase sigma factor [Solirubrobacteraceae bacterium]|nr:SigB/SigF/SigG family RNA polymerase sigma factor [Solirubrobacteraceae bacterium]
MPAQQRELARGAAAHRRARAGEDADLRRYAEERDPAARERLTRAYLPLALSIARRFDRGRVALEDLNQVASIGLLKALDRFDPDNGAAFTSFAVPTIQGELRRYFRDYTWTVRPPRDLQERVVRIERDRDQLTNQLGRAPTAAELAERLGCTLEEVVEAAEAAHARRGDSLDAPAVEREDADTLGERLGIEDPGFEAAEASAMASHLLAALPERDRLAVILRFRDDLTQAEIGRRLGCSQMHVSRILRSALTRLRIEAEGASDGDRPSARPLELA